MVDALRLKILSKLSKALESVIDHPKQNEITKWVNLLQRLWDNLDDAKHYSKLRQGNTQPQQSKKKKPNHQEQQVNSGQGSINVYSSGDPMDLIWLQLTLDQCAYCKATGHWKDNCLKKLYTKTSARSAPSRRGG